MSAETKVKMTRAEINHRICEFLGIDPDRVVKVTLVLEGCDLPKVTVERLVLDMPDAVVKREFVLLPSASAIVDVSNITEHTRRFARRPDVEGVNDGR